MLHHPVLWQRGFSHADQGRKKGEQSYGLARKLVHIWRRLLLRCQLTQFGVLCAARWNLGGTLRLDESGLFNSQHSTQSRYLYSKWRSEGKNIYRRLPPTCLTLFNINVVYAKKLVPTNSWDNAISPWREKQIALKSNKCGTSPEVVTRHDTWPAAAFRVTSSRTRTSSNN